MIVNASFSLGDPVKLTVSDERGTIRARAEYENGENAYLVFYKAADGRAVEGWWGESQIEVDEVGERERNPDFK